MPLFGCSRGKRCPNAESLYELDGGAIHARSCRTSIARSGLHRLRHVKDPLRSRTVGREGELSPEALTSDEGDCSAEAAHVYKT